MLTALVALGERVMVEVDTPGAAEFERLHHKFDLVIELLGALLRTTVEGRMPRKRKPSASAAGRKAAVATCAARPRRSEEHKSELQSLMRISYAVFCLKKQQKIKKKAKI